MIENEVEYSITKRRVGILLDSIKVLGRESPTDPAAARIKELFLNSFRSQAEDLKEEIREWEARAEK